MSLGVDNPHRVAAGVVRCRWVAVVAVVEQLAGDCCRSSWCFGMAGVDDDDVRRPWLLSAAGHGVPVWVTVSGRCCGGMVGNETDGGVAACTCVGLVSAG